MAGVSGADASVGWRQGGELSLAWYLPVPEGCFSVSVFRLICQATNQVQPWYLWMAYSKMEIISDVSQIYGKKSLNLSIILSSMCNA